MLDKTNTIVPSGIAASDDELLEAILKKQGLEVTPEAIESLKEDRMRAQNQRALSDIQKEPKVMENLKNTEASELKKQASIANNKKELLPMDEWKKQYGSSFNKPVEDMSERLAPSINDFKKAARMDKLKNLAKGVGKGLATGAAWGLALDPSEIANSEMPYDQEGMDKLQADMQAKNEQYNRPTKFGNIRKMLGR